MIVLAADITPEELQVFLQDTNEQLQLLDEDIIKLENGSDNGELLQEIFRAAHTIKGSSAMLGYHKMADLTHAMESILDRLRKGTLLLTSEIVDALLASLDALRSLRNNLTSPTEEDIDVSSSVATLEALANSQANDEQPVAEDDDELVIDVSLDEAEKKRLQEALALGNRVYRIGVKFDKESQWRAVRCMQALSELASKGVVITSDPTPEKIESEEVGNRIDVIFATQTEAAEIEQALGAIPDSVGTEIGFYNPLGEAEDTPEDMENSMAEMAVLAQTMLEGAPESPVRKSEGSAKSSPVEAVKVAETVRIDVERLDSLMTMIGELVVARTRMNQIGRALELQHKDDEDVIALGKTFTHITKVVDQLQLDITVARMLPVGVVFNRMPRMVRDLARKVGKKIDFAIAGQETGIDRSVVEHISDPLIHLLRNAIDHGIETPEERKAAGKQEKAKVRLSAAHEQNFIMITVADDGRGIDGAMIRETAVRKGVITPDVAARMSDSEAIDLIFESGMSTAKKTTDVSGRGVGMDIVRQNIEAFNGDIAVDTAVGEGTTFTLRLPLTLATIHGLLVSSNNTIYAIPLVGVSETLRINPEEIETVTQREVIRLRDRIVPLIRLNEALRTGDRKGDNDGKCHIVVTKTGERMVGLVVDSLMEPQEVVVKSMGSLMGNIQGIAGASILGSGEVALILDVPSLIKSVVLEASN